MATTTGIAWARSTFNPWIGCTEVSPGCDGCYARVLDQRMMWGGVTHWGAGVSRRRVAASTWAHPLQWDKAAAHEAKTGKVLVQSKWKGPAGFWPVFPSLCDPFDNEVSPEWRGDFFNLISETPNLTWLLLTKRIGNVARMLPVWWEDPAAWAPVAPYANVWIGASVVNQEEADRDIPKLLAVPAAKRFVSYEPALGPIDFVSDRGNHEVWDYLSGHHKYGEGGDVAGVGGGVVVERTSRLDQIIVGGESNQGSHRARPFNLAWARSTIEQCRAAGVAVFVKQLGSNPVVQPYPSLPPVPLSLEARGGADPGEWPADLHIQEFPQ